MSIKKTIFITGIAGFFGKHLAQLFLQNSYRVIGFDIRQPHFRHANLVFVNGELSELEKLIIAVKSYKPSHFIHLAGLIKSKSDQTLFDVNVCGMHTVCEAISMSGLSPQVTLISSSAVYKPSCDKISEYYELVPVTNYGLTKKIQEDIVLNYSERGFFTYRIFRPFNLIGHGMPNNLAVAAFIDKLKTAKHQGVRSIEVGNLNSIRDYIDIRDAADVVFKVIDNQDLENEVVNVCSGTGYQMGEILKLCCDILCINPDVHINNNLIQKNDVGYQVGNIDKLCKYYDVSKLHNIQSSLLAMLKS
jgi:nucleoside-diphosphate-sugar epimerase